MKFMQFLKQEDGASAAEYALILGVVGAVIATGLISLRDEIDTAIGNATEAVQTANDGNGGGDDTVNPPA